MTSSSKLGRNQILSRRTHKLFRGFRRGSHVVFTSIDGAVIGFAVATVIAGVYLVYLTKKDAAEGISTARKTRMATKEVKKFIEKVNKREAEEVRESMDLWDKIKSGITYNPVESTIESLGESIESFKKSLTDPIQNMGENMWDYVHLSKRSLKKQVKNNKGVFALVTYSGTLLGLYKGYVKGTTEINSEIHAEKILRRMKNKRRKKRKSQSK